MKIIITGHLGFIGSYLCKLFESDGIEFIGLDIKEGNDILTCDLPDADVIIHLAAQSDVMSAIEDPIEDARTNILGTIRLAEKYKDKKFIFSSSGGYVQEKVESPYGMSKFCAEEYIKMICSNYSILRLPNIYGCGSRSVVEKFINGDIYIYGKGTATRDYVHVTDIIEVIKSSVVWGKGTFYLGSEIITNVLELAEATGKEISYYPKRDGEIEHSIVKNNTIWRPKVNVIEFIKDSCNK